MSNDSAAPKPLVANEGIKIASNHLRGNLAAEFADTSTPNVSADSEQLIKFHGTYIQDDRDQRITLKRAGQDKAWMFMLRVRLPGGKTTPKQWLVLDSLAAQYQIPSLRLTTRQTFQFHGVLKGQMKPLIQEMNKVLLALKLMRTKSNVSKPRPSFAHTRSSSLSSSTASIESQANNQPNQLCIRRSGLKKVHKRNSRDSRPLFTQSLHNLSQDTHEHTSAYAATYNNDYFAPLPMLYANHGQSLSALLLSVDSLYSVAAHSSTDSSTDSLMGSSSPFTEVMDDLDLISSKNASNVVLASASARPRVTLTRLHTRLSAGPPLFSPTVSLPFFDAHAVDDLSDDSFLTADHL